MSESCRDVRNLLIPFDFSEVCENALNHGLELASRCRNRILLLHVVTQERKSRIFSKSDGAFTHLRRLNAIRSRCEEHFSVEIEVIVKSGKLLQEIERVAADREATVILLGTHGKRGVQQLFGSYALKIMVESTCPVIAIQQDARPTGFGAILVPVTRATDPRPGMPFLIQLAKAYGSKVVLLGSGKMDLQDSAEIGQIITDVSAALSTEGIRTNLSHAIGDQDFAGETLRISKEKNCNLIMIPAVPGPGLPGFGFEAWNERLMFDEGGVPVMTFPVS